MKNWKMSVVRCLMAGSALVSTNAAFAQGTPGLAVVFLPASPDSEPDENTTAGGITQDGRVVGGYESDGGVIWTDGVAVRVTVPGLIYDASISGDGSTLFGTTVATGGFRPFVRRSGSTTLLLPNPSEEVQVRFATAASTDGRYITVNGSSSIGQVFLAPGSVQTYRAYRWSESGGYLDLGQFDPVPAIIAGRNQYGGISASAISGDGNIIAGGYEPYNSNGFSPRSGQGAFVWTQAGGLQKLPFLTAPATASALDNYASVRGISRDGSTIVGAALGSDGNVQAVYWRNGTITGLGHLPGTTPAQGETSAFAANADGSVIVGGSFFASDLDRAWRWSAVTGMQDLTILAQNAGLALNGFVLRDAVGVSDNGQFITGNARNSELGQSLAYVLQLAQVTQTQLIVRVILPGVTLESIVNQSFNTEVTGTLNGQTVFTRSFTDPINSTTGTTALAAARAALTTTGLRRVTIGTPVLLSNTTTVTSQTNNTVNVTSTQTTTAAVNTLGPATVQTGDLGICATAATNGQGPTGCSLPGTATAVSPGILNSNIYSNSIQSITPTTTPMVNQLITARWQVAATAGNQFGTVHALAGPASFEQGDRLMRQLLRNGMVSGDGNTKVARQGANLNESVSALGGSDSGLSMFGSYYHSWSSVDADASVPVAQVNGNTDGFVLGIAKDLDSGVRLGVAVDHGSNDQRVADPLYPETMSVKQTQAAVFAGWTSGRLSLSGTGAYGFGNVSTTLASPGGISSAKRDLDGWSLGGQARYLVPLGKDAQVGLVSGIRHSSAKLHAFTEAGGSSPLTGLERTVSRTRLFAGLEGEAVLNLGSVELTPRLHARAAHDSGDYSGVANVVFASNPSGPVYQALGPGTGEWAAELGGSIEMAMGSNINLWASYDAGIKTSASIQSVQAGLSIKF